MEPTISIGQVLGALFLFQLKHFLADFVLQTRYQWKNKGRYGHLGGLLHAAVHLVGSLPAAWLLFGPGFALVLIVVAESVFHYHVDWTKELINRRFELTSGGLPYWAVFGGDQLVHQITYLIILYLALR